MKTVKRALNSRKKSLKYKFGVLVPNDFRHAKEIDMKNGNKEWEAAMDTEL